MNNMRSVSTVISVRFFFMPIQSRDESFLADFPFGLALLWRLFRRYNLRHIDIARLVIARCFVLIRWTN
jgi:hypothetical protein